MKVVQINAVYELSSTGRTSMELHTYLTKHGIESYKFYATPLHNSKKKDLIGNWIDRKIHALLSRLFGRQAYFSHIPTLNLVRKLRKIGPDVVILRNLHGNYINLPILTKYLAKNDIATIVVLHDCWFFTGHCCHYTEKGCFKWQKECHECPLINADIPSWFIDTSRKVFRDKKKRFSSIQRLAVVGVSDWITEEVRKAPIFSNAKIFRRIYNWINLDIFYPRQNTIKLKQKLGLNATDFIALGVSMTWDYHKGLGVFVELAKKMPQIKILLIGKRPDIELPSNIISIPATKSTEDLANYYSMADVMLNFSIQETFGKAAAEALSCGTPLIVNNATANPEIPGDCGFVINDNNIDQIVNAIKKIRSKGIDFYSERCVNRAHQLFNKDTNIEQYITLFDELMQN